ncbi:MAG: hypothetical protein PHD48_12095 [Alphaproteobacteria bacterium]|nr:hypothetical protein [Alphaproteobacteria bacterium]
MFDFDVIITKHSESLIQQLVETWERYNNVRHERPMMLEERWEHFIRATDPATISVAA